MTRGGGGRRRPRFGRSLGGVHLGSLVRSVLTSPGPSRLVCWLIGWLIGWLVDWLVVTLNFAGNTGVHRHSRERPTTVGTLGTKLLVGAPTFDDLPDPYQ